MDRAGRKAGQLSSDELTMVFDLVARGGRSEEARRLLGMRGRDRSTANRLYNVTEELEARNLDALDTATAQEIADAARYSTTPSYVQDIYLRWRAWRNRPNPCEDSTHQKFLRDRLILLMLELSPLVHSFPEVFRLSYHPEDPTNRLKWREEDGIKRVEWELAVEQQSGWSLVQGHLWSGMPEVAHAMAGAKQSYAGYCESLLILEENYRERAKQQQIQTTWGVEINDSHFYRSILAEVDKPGETNEGCEYQYNRGPANFSVAFAGAELITQAEDLTTAQHWVDLHRQWRQEVRSEYLAEPLKFRQDVENAAWVVIGNIERLELGGPVPGKCDRF